jgi:hypothetical protein
MVWTVDFIRAALIEGSLGGDGLFHECNEVTISEGVMLASVFLEYRIVMSKRYTGRFIGRKHIIENVLCLYLKH